MKTNPFAEARKQTRENGLNIDETAELIAKAFGEDADFLGHEVLMSALAKIAEVDRLENITGVEKEFYRDSPHGKMKSRWNKIPLSSCPGIKRRSEEADAILAKYTG